jgi:hypothetical protein
LSTGKNQFAGGANQRVLLCLTYDDYAPGLKYTGVDLHLYVEI